MEKERERCFIAHGSKKGRKKERQAGRKTDMQAEREKEREVERQKERKIKNEFRALSHTRDVFMQESMNKRAARPSFFFKAIPLCWALCYRCIYAVTHSTGHTRYTMYSARNSVKSAQSAVSLYNEARRICACTYAKVREKTKSNAHTERGRTGL